MFGSQDDIPPPPPSQTLTQQTPHIVLTIKLPILKKGEYDIWAMKMEHYLAHTDYPIWEVIQNENGLYQSPQIHKLLNLDFGGIDEIKKMQKYILKQQFKGFSVSNSKGLHKVYDRFQSLLSQLEFHGANVSTEDANPKFLRSLPSTWSQVFLNHTDQGPREEFWLKSENKGNQDSKRRDAWNSGNKIKENERRSVNRDSKALVTIDGEGVSTEDANQKFLRSLPSAWSQVSLIMRTKPGVDSLSFDNLYNNLRVFENDVKGSTASSSNTTKGNQDSKRRDAWNSGDKDKENGRRSGKQEDSKALVTIDGEGSDTEKVEAQLVAHQQGQLWYEEKIRFMKIDLDDKTDVLTYHKKLLAEAEKEKEDLKAKIEKWHNSSKNLSILLNSQMSANDKFGLRYGDYRYDGILSYENKVLQSVFMNKESDLENYPLYDRFVTAEGMHVVPPPMIGNYMPSGPDIEIDYSQFTYGPKQSQASEYETQTSDFDTCDSNCSDKTHESLPEPAVNEPRVVSQPKVWYDAPIIEEYESYSEDEHVSLPIKEHETHSFANKQVKTPRETVKNQFTYSKNPKFDKKGLGYGFTTKACFVCGSLSHLIRDCDFYEKRMAKQAELNNRMRKKSSQREIRPIWKNVQRMNHKTNLFQKQHAIPTNAANIVNTVKSIVNNARPKKVNAVSVVGGKRETVVKPSAGAAKASSTIIVNTASTPVSTASPYGGLSFTDLTNIDQDDSEIPALEEIYDNPTDGIFTNSSYDDEGAVADFTNLEPVVNVSPIPTSRINSIHPSTLILGDPNSAVQTRSKVTKSSGA
ncbi:hypothetical protein Tco_1030658 [Tanacetum coccineum]|uniref:Uncharacterized protein n=1 Tax=Tanacetum coccineum TaxID=301880 RepID=A0ABQ5G6U4_9ASTR